MNADMTDVSALFGSIATASQSAMREAEELRVLGVHCNQRAPFGADILTISTMEDVKTAEAQVKELIAREREQAKAMLRKPELAAHDGGSINGSALESVLGDDIEPSTT